jgi:hypothetical protein
MTPSQRKTSGRASAVGAVLITKGIQIWGIYLATQEIRQPGDADEAVLAFCALLFLGSQAAEDLALRVLDRLFAAGAEEERRGNGS